ncbi:hypothetical protein [Leuconostoc rapi]|uniref:hypothetical protein n=1 Tax=Leuconostoc rapi TaxID=1406906 RepID=UPI001958D680|nr:hypothetical protein [Leuconostoc rapi]MBM7436377.1 TM2 domain-containing membrane protein YozV [Leuconostoc rapi]
MKSLSPKLQKYIDDNSSKTQNIGTLVAIIALFVSLFLLINTGIHVMFGNQNFTNLFVYLIEIAVFVFVIIARVNYVKSKSNDLYQSMYNGTYDYSKIKDWNRFDHYSNVCRLIVKFKLTELFPSDVISTRLTVTGVTVAITPVVMITTEQLQENILNDFSVNAENIKFSEDGSSYRFEMSLARLKLIKPQDIVEYH